MEGNHNIRLTSAELGQLWSSYMSDSMALCIFKYFLEKAEDAEIIPVINYGIKCSQKHLNQLKTIFLNENHAIPNGFTEEDVNTKAPRLFADTFFLHFIKHMVRVGLKANSLALALATRTDAVDYYTQCLTESAVLNNMVTTVMLSKGIYIKPPYIPNQDKVEFVQKQNFLDDLFGEKHRPLLAIEVTNIYSNIQTNAIGSALVLAFSQVAKSKEVREFMIRGYEIATKQIEIFHEILLESNLSSAGTLQSEVTDCTISPFSDKLMMFLISATNSVGMGDYGDSLALTMRKDIAVTYTRLLAENGLYAEDGANIMIKNGWMEQPPQAADRNALAGI